MEPFLIGFLNTRHPRLGNYKTFPTVYLPLKSDLKWPQTKSAKRPDHYRSNSNDRFMIKGGNSINRYRVGSLPRYKYTRTCTRTHNLVSTQVNMFTLEEERTSKWFSFTNTTCMHRSIFAFAWDRENSWNHILNKNFVIEGIDDLHKLG